MSMHNDDTQHFYDLLTGSDPDPHHLATVRLAKEDISTTRCFVLWRSYHAKP